MWPQASETVSNRRQSTHITLSYSVRQHRQCWTPPYRLLVRGGGYCWLQTKALCNFPAGRESLGGTTIECQHSQLSGVEDEGEVFALIQQGPHHLQSPTSYACFLGARHERSRGTKPQPKKNRQICLAKTASATCYPLRPANTITSSGR